MLQTRYVWTNGSCSDSFIPFPDGGMKLPPQLSQDKGNIWLQVCEVFTLALTQSKGFTALTIIFQYEIVCFVLHFPCSWVLLHPYTLTGWLTLSENLFVTCPSARHLCFNFPETTTYLPGYRFIYLLQNLPTNHARVLSAPSLYPPDRFPKRWEPFPWNACARIMNLFPVFTFRHSVFFCFI